MTNPPAKLSTARALVWFRQELLEAGFTPDLADSLTEIVAEADVRASGLDVADPGSARK